MSDTTKNGYAGGAWQFAALLGGNAALALGPWFVRLADTGPVAAGFWRLALAWPVLVVLALATRQSLFNFGPRVHLLVMAGGVIFALDLASWHIGIEWTRLANATLFGNAGSLILMLWGFVLWRRWPHRKEWLAVLGALGGAAILLGRSLDLSVTYLLGDLFCLLAGLFYAGYLIILQGARGKVGSWSLLVWVTLAGAPTLLGIALLRGEPVWPSGPGAWWPVIALAVSSQLVGQGLLVFSLKHFPPLVIGLALLTQPAIAALVGWLAFAEVLGLADLVGMALLAGSLLMAKQTERRIVPNPVPPPGEA